MHTESLQCVIHIFYWFSTCLLSFLCVCVTCTYENRFIYKVHLLIFSCYYIWISSYRFNSFPGPMLYVTWLTFLFIYLHLYLWLTRSLISWTKRYCSYFIPFPQVHTCHGHLLFLPCHRLDFPVSLCWLPQIYSLIAPKPVAVPWDNLDSCLSVLWGGPSFFGFLLLKRIRATSDFKSEI
jgi:hypothetical protein